MIPLNGVEEVKVEAGFNGFSSVVLISVPIVMSTYIPVDPALYYLGPVTSSNIFSQMREQLDLPAMTLANIKTPMNATSREKRARE